MADKVKSGEIKLDPHTLLDAEGMGDLLVKEYDKYEESDFCIGPIDFQTFRAGFAYGIAAIEREIPGAYRFTKKELADAE